MSPENIQVGKHYSLSLRNVIHAHVRTSIVRKVLSIQDGSVIVHSISGNRVAIPLHVFAQMACEERRAGVS